MTETIDEKYVMKGALEALKLAEHDGVTLTVPPDVDTVRVTPKEKLTAELRDKISGSRDDVMRLVLLRQASRYLSPKTPPGAGETILARLRAEQEALDEAWWDDFPDYRQAVRNFTQAALREIQRYQQQGY